MHTYAEFPLDHFDKNMHLVIWTKQKRGRNDNIYIGCEPIILHQGLCSKNCFNFAVFSPSRWWKGISQRGKIHFLESNMKRQLTSENGKVEGRKMIFSVLFMAKWFSGFILVVFLRQRKKNNGRATNCWDPLQPYQRCFVGTSCVKLAGIFSLLNKSLSTSSPSGKSSSIGAKWILSLMHSKKSENHSASLFHWKVYGTPPIYWFIMAPLFRSCAIYCHHGVEKKRNLESSNYTIAISAI